MSKKGQSKKVSDVVNALRRGEHALFEGKWSNLTSIEIYRYQDRYGEAFSVLFEQENTVSEKNCNVLEIKKVIGEWQKFGEWLIVDPYARDRAFVSDEDSYELIEGGSGDN